MALKDKAARIDLSNIGIPPLNKPAGQGAKTAIGLHADALFRDEKVAEENASLKEQLKSFEGAQPTRRLDPKLVLPSRWANRVEESFLAPDFMSLKAEIESSGGNVQPIKVRPIGADKFEIIYGHRRHRACLELGIEVLATIESVEDAQLFTEMDRENRERQALRPYETGLMYARALDQGLFASARKLSEAISADLTYVGRALKLARLPDDVIRAFRSPLDLQFAWASELSEALQKDPDGVLLRAKGLAQRLDKPPAKDVLRQLVQGGSTVLPPKKPSLRIKGKFGEVILDVSRVDVSKVDVLERAIRTALGG